MNGRSLKASKRCIYYLATESIRSGSLRGVHSSLLASLHTKETDMKTKLKTIEDSLYNCDSDCVRSFPQSSIAKNDPGVIYGQGIVNGVVSTVMAITGCSFKTAISEVKSRTTEVGPHGAFDIRCVPQSWRDAWESAPVHQPN